MNLNQSTQGKYGNRKIKLYRTFHHAQNKDLKSNSPTNIKRILRVYQFHH